MKNIVLPLDSPEATLGVAGGKGANLNRLIRAGFPVPPGFLVTTAAYRAFLQAKGLEEQIIELSRSASAADPISFENASQAIRRVFDEESIPTSIAREIHWAYQDLCYAVEPHLCVAVRSSATAEDLPTVSFAGQQDTYLNVRGEEALLVAVRRCWSSLWTARAIVYRARTGIDPTMVSLAVVVQQMVPAEAAGILFTINPLTEDRDEAVINAVWGLGETVVGGRVTPDTVVVDKATGRVKYAEAGDKAVMTVSANEGTTEIPVDPQHSLQLVLTSELVGEVVGLGRDIEDHFGVPQDIEWAIAGGKVYILQSRPVTGLRGTRSEPHFEEPAVPGDDNWPALGEHPPQPFDLWTQVNMGEAWPNPVTPLTWSTIPSALNTTMRNSLRGLKTPYLDHIQWANRFYGRIYFNEGALAHVLSHEYGLPSSFLDAAFGSRGHWHRRPNGGFRLFRFLHRLPILIREAMGQLRAARELMALFPQINDWVDEFLNRNLDTLSDRELWNELRMIWVERCMRVLNLHGQVNNSAMRTFALLERLLTRWCNRKELTHDLVTGLSGIYAAQMGVSLWQIARKLEELGLTDTVLENSAEKGLAKLRETPAGGPVLNMMDDFLKRFGHRCACEAEWLHPRWAEAPELIIEVIAGYLRAGDRVNPAEVETRQRRRREDAINWIEAHIGLVRKTVLRRVLTRAQQAVRLRDNGRHYFMKMAVPIRQIYKIFGKRWAARGWLRQVDDFFFLTVQNIESIINGGDPRAAGLNLHTLVTERRKAYKYWFDFTAPEVIGHKGEPITVSSVDESSETVLHGIPASGGQVQGTARIIFNPWDAKQLQQGEILITRATDPGWTPVFPLIGGLVLEVGGQLSHGAIVAREYGVPAVVNVNDALRRIKNGQTITIDGTKGLVSLEGT